MSIVCFAIVFPLVIIFLMFAIFAGIAECYKLHINNSIESKKNNYWLKPLGDRERLEEDNCLYVMRFCTNIGVIMCMMLIFFLLDAFQLYDFRFIDRLCTIDGCKDIVGFEISILALISLVWALKKDYYLGITVKDVIKRSCIPGCLINIFTCGVYILVGHALYYLKVIQTDVSMKRSVGVFTYSVWVYLLFNMMRIIYCTIKLCLNTDKKELEVFQCFRYKIIHTIQVDNSQIIDEYVVGRILTYLLRNIFGNFRILKSSKQQLKNVKLESILSDKQDKKVLKRLQLDASSIVLFFVSVSIIVSIYGTFASETKCPVEILAFGILMTIILFLYGYKRDLWLLLFSARYYCVFYYQKLDSGKTSTKIASCGNNFLWSKRFEFIGSIEDLLGFYKMLLYDARGKKKRYIVIERVNSMCEKETELIRNTILLLLYYLEYEKIFLKTEQTLKNGVRNKKSISREELVKKVNREVKKKDIINYNQLHAFIEQGDNKPIEYQLANMILSHVYKEPKIENGKIIPDELENFKFMCFYEHICA